MTLADKNESWLVLSRFPAGVSQYKKNDCMKFHLKASTPNDPDAYKRHRRLCFRPSYPEPRPLKVYPGSYLNPPTRRPCLLPCLSLPNAGRTHS